MTFLRVLEGTSPWLWVPVAFLAVALTGAYLIGARSARRPVTFDLRKGSAESRTLVVILHGYMGSPRSMQRVTDVAREVHPDADVLLPHYAAGPLSNKSPFDVADEIERHIDGLYAARELGEGSRYHSIVLVGFSMGALLLRKAYVWGHGQDFSADRPEPLRKRAWVDNVSRLVLLAGMNRGWTISRKEDRRRNSQVRQSPLPIRMLFRLGVLFGTLTRTGNQMLAFARGSPFVADLRVQWITLARRTSTKEGRAPMTAMVVQLLGTQDDIVSPVDNQDLIASTDFFFIPIAKMGHGAMIRLDISANAATQRTPAWEAAQALRKALGASYAQLQADSSVVQQQVDERPEITDAIFVMHGIRDYGHWTTRIAKELYEPAGQPARRDRLAVITSSYGYFPMGRFLLLGARQKNVRWFMDRFTETRAYYPNADISFVGHSNGTYILASALARYKSLVVKRALFAGSVVNTTYDWNSLMRGPEPRVELFRNIVASRDWVVGIFPRFFEFIAETTPLGSDALLDLGAAGFNGFDQRELNIEFASGRHDAAIRDGDDARKRIKAIADFLALGDVDGLQLFAEASAKNPAVSLLSRLCWLVWLLLVGGLVALGGVVMDSSQAPALGLTLYVLGVIAILYSV